MNKTTTSALLSGFTKFFNELCTALFVSSDKKEFRRLKDFIAS